MAVSFLAATRRSATFRRSMESLLRDSPRSPLPGVPMEGTAFTASSFVMRPSFPDPVTVLGSMPFSSRILRAAGEATPEA